MMTMTSNTVGCVFKKITENLENCIPGCELPQGSLKLSFVIVLVVGAQLLVTVSTSRAVIFLLLMTSGDVERNPGPEQMLTSRFNSSYTLWLSVQSFSDKTPHVLDTLSGLFHDSHYSLRICLFAISMQQIFHSGKSITMIKQPHLRLPGFLEQG